MQVATNTDVSILKIVKMSYQKFILLPPRYELYMYLKSLNLPEHHLPPTTNNLVKLDRLLTASKVSIR